MADFETMDRFWGSFHELKNILYRNISLLSLVTFVLTYQIIAVEFFVEEESPNACNNSGHCVHTQVKLLNGSMIMPTIKAYTQVDFEDSRALLLTTHYVSMLLGVLILGLMADKFGRRRVLFCSLTFTFCSSLLSSVLIQNISVFIPFMMVTGFTSGISLLIVFILAAEYVNPGRRPLVLVAIWLSSTLSCISFAGLAYIVESRKTLMVAVSLPLLMTMLLYNMIPESPRWMFLQIKAPVPESVESQKLLTRFISEEQSSISGNGCWSMGVSGEGRCFNFLRKKELRRATIIIAQAWFSIGMLYRALNTSSIQLLKNFYSNYAVREIINIPAFACHVFFVTCVGRRLTTLLGMVLSGVLCVVFAAASDGFFSSEYQSITVVIQLVGRFFVVVSMTSLGVYSIELFPTTVRCSALGLVTSFAFLGAAVTPLFMELQSINPMIPLAILGSLSLLAGVLLRAFLPETKGSMTSETLDDTVVGRRDFNKPWSPQIRFTRDRRRVNGAVMLEESCPDQMDSPSSPITNDSIDEFKDLRQSWEVSFDRASRTSKWEWLSYEDAHRRLPSLDIELSLQDQSHLLDEDDLEKLSIHVPGNSWILLYSTYLHGFSLKTLYHRLEDVETPVLMAIKDNKDYVFGVFSPTPPKVHPGFYGYGKSFFFTCRPNYKVFPCSGKNEYYLNCNTDSLAFGCSDGLFGLWLDCELYRGRSTACETYNSEMLSATEDFTCIGLEVWTFA